MQLSKEFTFVIPEEDSNVVREWFHKSDHAMLQINNFNIIEYEVPGLGNHNYVTVDVHPGMEMRDFLKILSAIVPVVERILLLKMSLTYQLNWEVEAPVV